MKSYLSGFAACAVFTFSSCHSAVSVKKVVHGDEPGVRYSLPQPFLVVTPLADGKVDVRWEFLPDSSQQYAIDSSTFLGSHDLTIETSQGLLTAVNWSGNSAEVAAEFAKAAGEIGKQRIESELEAAKEEQAKKEEQLKALRDAQLEYQQALARVRALEESGVSPDEQVFKDALIALEQAEAKRDFYRELYGSESFDDPSRTGISTEKIQISRSKRHGPVWFRLVECPDTHILQLVAVPFPLEGQVVTQGIFETYTVPNSAKSPGKGQPGTKPVAMIDIKPTMLTIKQADLSKKHDIELKTELSNAPLNATLESDDLTQPAPGKPKIEYVNSRLVRIKLPESLDIGSYQFAFDWVPDANEDPIPSDILDIEIEGP